MAYSAITKIGYALIRDPSEDFRPQLELLEGKGCQKLYHDVAISIESDRPGLSELLLELASKDRIEILCRDFLTMFSKVEAFIPVVELIIERKSRLVFIQDQITISIENGYEVISVWSDLLEFRRKHRRRKISQKKD